MVLPLTTTFRCAPAVCNVANALLRWVKQEKRTLEPGYLTPI